MNFNKTRWVLETQGIGDFLVALTGVDFESAPLWPLRYRCIPWYDTMTSARLQAIFHRECRKTYILRKCQKEIGQLKKNNWKCNTRKRTVQIWSTLQHDLVVLRCAFITKKEAPVKRLSRHKAQSADWTYFTVRLTGLFLCAFSEQVNRASAMRSSIHQYLHLGRATKWTSPERSEGWICTRYAGRTATEKITPTM